MWMEKDGRGRGIRTPGLLLPKQALYQTELYPVNWLVEQDSNLRIFRLTGGRLTTWLSTNALVEVGGFEPPTPCSQSRCATRLRYTPESSYTLLMNHYAFVLGLCAIPVSVWRFQLSTRTALLISAIPILFFVGGSYYLNHEPQGAVMVLASTLFNLAQAALGLGEWAHSRIARFLRASMVILAAFFGAWWAPPTSWQTTLPFWAYIIARTGEYALTPQILRRFYVASTVTWGSYAILTGNVPIFVMEVLTLASNIVWLARNPMPAM